MHHRIKTMTAAASVAAALLLAGCTTNMGSGASPGQQETAIDNGVEATLATLYSSVPGSRELARKANGILVFPRVVAAGLVVGGDYGRGALQVRDQTVGYYQTTGLSLGLQAGAESKALVFMFMTQEALDRFLTSKGWTAGVDASVAVLRAGANGTLDTRSATAAVNAFALTNSGLMAAANVEGTRVSKLDLPVPLR
ncbi:YSC84-related protein [Ramlibacter sp.]|uniref:BPSL1445 family SYLF domain-containing lipoprotein n=1 Tax=Ramlibacter sp. TaxID=1917967 RepID=UPI00263881A9|nr:YSC84-related protein [Ramlibacter sp.]MDB5956421.1 twin-arginine translocation pathway signal [Ramlibacter sp.]